MSIATQDKSDVLLAMRVNVWSKVAFVNSIQLDLSLKINCAEKFILCPK